MLKNASHVVITALLFAIVSIASAKPERPVEKKAEGKKQSPVSDLNGETNWGNLLIADKELLLSGHPTWTAIGTVLPSGKIKLTWATTDGGREGHGLYTWDGKELRRIWGWVDGCAYQGL